MTNRIHVTTNLTYKAGTSAAYMNKIKITTLEDEQELCINVQQAYHLAMELLRLHSEYTRATTKDEGNFVHIYLPDTDYELDRMGYKNLGWVNGWTPEQSAEYNKLTEGKKCRGGRCDWSCCSMTICDVAKVYWKCDSGD